MFFCHGYREGTVIFAIELVISGNFFIRQYNGNTFAGVGELLGQVKACAGAQAQQAECCEELKKIPFH